MTASSAVVVRFERLRMWDAATGARLVTYEGHSNWVDAVAWSPAGRHMASANDSTVQVWDALSGNAAYTYRGHSAPVTSVAWSPGGEFVASASEDKTVRVWRAS